MSKIREIAAGDIPGCIEILGNVEDGFIPGENAAGAVEVLKASLGRGIVYVAEEDGGIAGLACFEAEPVFALGGILRFVVVKDTLRRRGIGRQLVGFVERKVFGRSRNLYLSIDPVNEVGLRFFEKLGFAEVGEITDVPSIGQSQSVLRKSSGSPTRRRATSRA